MNEDGKGWVEAFVYEDDDGRPGHLLPDDEPLRVGARYWIGEDPSSMRLVVGASVAIFF